MEEKREVRHVWRKIEGGGSYPGQYVASDAKYLKFSAYISVLYILNEEGERPSFQLRYSVDGDSISTEYVHSIDEAVEWLRQKWSKVVNDNLRALASPVDIQVEDT